MNPTPENGSTVKKLSVTAVTVVCIAAILAAIAVATHANMNHEDTQLQTKFAKRRKVPQSMSRPSRIVEILAQSTKDFQSVVANVLTEGKQLRAQITRSKQDIRATQWRLFKVIYIGTKGTPGKSVAGEGWWGGGGGGGGLFATIIVSQVCYSAAALTSLLWSHPFFLK